MGTFPEENSRIIKVTPKDHASHWAKVSLKLPLYNIHTLTLVMFYKQQFILKKNLRLGV